MDNKSPEMGRKTSKGQKSDSYFNSLNSELVILKQKLAQIQRKEALKAELREMEVQAQI